MRFALFLPVINVLSITTGNFSYPYRFDVHQVDKCPRNATEFETAAQRRNCTENTRYLCAPDKYLSNLIEFCTDRGNSLFQNGNCVLLDGTGDLNHFRCKDKFNEGCPTKPYNDDEIYKYPACLEIQKDFKCFIADKDCPRDTDTRNETNTKSVDDNIIICEVIVIVGVFLSVAIMTALIGIFIYKNQNIEKDQNKLHIDERKLRLFLSRKEMTVHHVRGIIVGCGSAGKTTLLRRLENAPFKDIINTESTALLDVYFNKFEVLEEEETIQQVREKNTQTANTIFTKMLANEPDHSEETYTRPDELKKKCDNGEGSDEDELQRENGIDKIEETSENIPFQRQKYEAEKPENPCEHHQLLPSRKKKSTRSEIYDTGNDKDIKANKDEKSVISTFMGVVEEISHLKHIRPQITFLDFAGQNMYYAFHQIYLSPRTFYVLVVDMTKSLEEKVKVIDTDETGCGVFDSWVYKDYYKFWLKSIDSFSDTRTPVIVVGTHSEKMSRQVRVFFLKD